MKKWIPVIICLLLLLLPACNDQKAEWTIGKKSSLAMDDTIEIDLQSLSPILPNRILLITKNDLMRML
jgi:hypothetical protein